MLAGHWKARARAAGTPLMCSASIQHLDLRSRHAALNLADNFLHADGAKAIAEALCVNDALTSLDLFQNELGPEGAKAIGNALRVNVALAQVTALSHNRAPPRLTSTHFLCARS